MTPADDNVSMTMDMLKDIVALEDQGRLADATGTEAIKAAFTEGEKKGSQLHSFAIEQEVVHYPVENSPIAPLEVNGLHSVHLLMPKIGNVGGPSMVNNSQPV